MSWATTVINHDFHFTLAYGDEAVSEWREVGIRGCDGDPVKFIKNSVADLAKEIVRSGKADNVWYHGLVLSESPLSAGAFCGEVFAHEGAVCMTDIGKTGLLVTPRETACTR